jgi:hypothetical protein
MLGIAFGAAALSLLAASPGPVRAFPSPTPRGSPTPTPSPSPIPVPLPSDLTADDILLRARQVATARAVPKFVAYRVDSDFRYNGRAFADRFDLRYRDYDTKVVGYTIPLSPDEARKRNAGINIAIFAIPIETNPNHEPIVIDVPLLSPLTTFGLATPRPTPAPNATAAPAGPPLRTIGRTVTATHEYDVAYIGMDPIDGHMLYHLTLKPVKGTKDLSTHRLRDLWVDPVSYDVPQLRTAGILGEKPYDRVTWTVRYALEGGDAWVIEKVWTADDLKFGDFLDETTIGGMTFTFHGFEFPVNIAPAMFDLAIP